MASPPCAAAAAAALGELLGETLVAPDGSAVATASLPARGVSLVGLYFGYCGSGGPGAQLAASLAAFYARFQPPANAAAAAAPSPAGAEQQQQEKPPQRLEIVFVSAEQDQPRWQEATRAMPWLALPFADKRRKV
ncbi:UNVERIFIED_CONTAM: hypothetical protein K2H54_032979 [Gekko kuhli]